MNKELCDLSSKADFCLCFRNDLWFSNICRYVCAHYVPGHHWVPPSQGGGIQLKNGGDLHPVRNRHQRIHDLLLRCSQAATQRFIVSVQLKPGDVQWVISEKRISKKNKQKQLCRQVSLLRALLRFSLILTELVQKGKVYLSLWRCKDWSCTLGRLVWSNTATQWYLFQQGRATLCCY